MNRSDMRTDFYNKVNETSSNSGFSTTRVNSFLQEGWQAIWSYKNTIWDWLRTECSLTTAFATITAQGSATSLTVASAANMYVGQKLYISDGTFSEECEILSISGTSLILVSPGLLKTDYASGSIVYGYTVQLPANFRNVFEVKIDKITSTSQETAKLKLINERDLDKISPRITSTGTPQYYYVKGRDLYLYPLPDASCRVKVKYVIKPVDLADATEPELPSEYHYLIVDYSVAKALSSDVRTKSANSGNVAAFYMSSFTNGLKNLAYNNSNRNLPDRWLGSDEDDYGFDN